MTSLSNIVRGLAIAAGLSLAAAAQAPSPDAVARAKRSFIDEMVKEHDFDRAEITALLDGAVIDAVVLETMARPAERVVPWFEYRNIFITEERIAAGVAFWNTHAETLDAVSERYGVAPEMIVSIVGIETYFGTRMGRYRVLDALATLAFAYPPRASFFASELESFLLLAREEQVDVTTALGSYAGAMGAGQFIPSSYRAYAVDADADGKRDLWTNWDDVFGSVANYFDKHGWRAGEPVMETALRNDVSSIVAECGGSCTCATCLVHVDEAWSPIVGPPSAAEEDMLDMAFEVKPTSRLSCQIKVTEALDGLVVHTPAYQGR